MDFTETEVTSMNRDHFHPVDKPLDIAGRGTPGILGPKIARLPPPHEASPSLHSNGTIFRGLPSVGILEIDLPSPPYCTPDIKVFRSQLHKLQHHSTEEVQAVLEHDYIGSTTLLQGSC